MARKGAKNIPKKKVAAIIVGVLAIIYIGLSVFFTSHFYFGTKINGESCSGKTVAEVEEMFGQVSGDYSLTLTDKRNKEFKITAKDINLTFHDEGQIQKIKDSQSSFGWIVGIFKDKDYKADVVRYDNAKLEKLYNGFELFDKNYVIEPKSAYPEYSRKTNSYEIRPEIYGNKVNKEALYKEIQKSILSGNKAINIDEAGLYVQPKNKEDNSKLAKAVEKLNKKVKMKVTYDFEDRKEVFSGYEIAQLLNCDSEGNYDITINRDRMIELLRGLSKQYSTYGDPRKFKASSGKEITIYGGSYGWLIDKEKEADELTKVLEAGKSVTREPVYSQTALHRTKDDIGNTYVEISLGGQYLWYYRDGKLVTSFKSVTREPVYSQTALHRTKDDIGNTYVEISLGGQYLWYYRDGKLVTSFPVVTGNVSKGHGTPGGIYPLNYKERDTYLNGRNYSSHVNYWMPFNGNIGLHDATWRGSFGGGIYRSNGSHGCVNYLNGRNYSSHVNYWMPFNGNIGLHDATWRGSFGGGIYRSNGSHGCVNCPYSGAATIYKTIEKGTPIILY